MKSRFASKALGASSQFKTSARDYDLYTQQNNFLNRASRTQQNKVQQNTYQGDDDAMPSVSLYEVDDDDTTEDLQSRLHNLRNKDVVVPNLNANVSVATAPSAPLISQQQSHQSFQLQHDANFNDTQQETVVSEDQRFDENFSIQQQQQAQYQQQQQQLYLQQQYNKNNNYENNYYNQQQQQDGGSEDNNSSEEYTPTNTTVLATRKASPAVAMSTNSTSSLSKHAQLVLKMLATPNLTWSSVLFWENKYISLTILILIQSVLISLQFGLVPHRLLSLVFNIETLLLWLYHMCFFLVAIPSAVMGSLFVLRNQFKGIAWVNRTLPDHQEWKQHWSQFFEIVCAYVRIMGGKCVDLVTSAATFTSNLYVSVVYYDDPLLSVTVLGMLVVSFVLAKYYVGFTNTVIGLVFGLFLGPLLFKSMSADKSQRHYRMQQQQKQQGYHPQSAQYSSQQQLLLNEQVEDLVDGQAQLQEELLASKNQEQRNNGATIAHQQQQHADIGNNNNINNAESFAPSASSAKFMFNGYDDNDLTDFVVADHEPSQPSLMSYFSNVLKNGFNRNQQ